MATRTYAHQPLARSILQPGNPLLLMVVIAATELALLNVILWARAEGTIGGLALAVTWPWIAAVLLPAIWSMAGGLRVTRAGALVTRPRAVAAALTIGVVLFSNLATLA